MNPMRRTDRQITKEQAFDLLRRAEYGTLSTVGPDGQPYGIPLSFCVDNNIIYFHCATEGHKIDISTCNPKVSFCVIGKTCVLPEKFSTQFENAILFGSVSEANKSEKQTALEGLVQKYSDDFHKEGLKYIAALNKKTRVFKISIETITGKARK